jgi:hypothetical protein
VVLVGAREARAQNDVQIRAEADADTVGVGDMLHVELSATSASTMPADPRTGSTTGFSVRGQNQSPSQTHISVNGSRSDRYTLVVDWSFQAQRTGTFSLGPMSVDVGGVRVQAKPLSVRVVPAGQAPAQRPRQQQPRPSPFGFSPFDPWRNLMPGMPPMPGVDVAPPTPPQFEVDPKLALDSAPGAVYFLHATVDRTSAVVGEQVTFSVLQYRDVAAAVELEEEDLHDAQVPDFVKHPLHRDDQEPTLVGYASVGGKTWEVRLVRKWALFPLRAGDLAIEPMSVTLARGRGSPGGTRRTEAFHVHVTEPPLAGRPPGYALGDVGRFNLAAQVQPRSVEQGGAVGVHVDLSGTGNLPAALLPAAREGVEWLAPEVHEGLGPADHDAYGGKRSFDFVVRLQKSGDVDLGELSLPFWDPDLRRYQVARAALGTVKVTPSVASGGAPAKDERPLQNLPPPRLSPEGPVVHEAHVDDSPLYWLGLAGGPLMFVAAVLARRVAGAWAGARRRRRASPDADLKERIASADAACRAGDPRGADAAIARALEAATLAHLGVSVRASVGEEVTRRLELAGVAPDAASSFATLLRECEAARFSPEDLDAAGVGQDAARSRWARAQGIIRTLERAQEKRA